MTTVQALVQDCHTRAITLIVEGETLHCDAPQGVLTATDKAALATHKPALLALLERWDEKSALLEYCDGYSRQDAERLAWEALGIVPPHLPRLAPAT